MIDSAQLSRLMWQTETFNILHPQCYPNDLMKLARAIYSAALEDAAIKFESTHYTLLPSGIEVAEALREMKETQ